MKIFVEIDTQVKKGLKIWLQGQTTAFFDKDRKTFPMKNSPVSILIPFYNAESTLEACLESVALNHHPNIQVVLVDDGSSDSSATIAQAFTRRDRRFELLSEPHRGLVPSLNRGLEACRHPWVARHDSDDLMPPDRLSAQLRCLEQQASLDVISGMVEAFPADQVQSGLRHYIAWLNSLREHSQITRDLFIESPLAHPSVMFRRDSVMALGGYRDFDGPEDYDLWLRLWRQGARFGKAPSLCLRWRQHPGRLTFKDQRYRAEAFLRLKLEVLKDTRLKDQRAVAVAGAGRDGKRLGRALKDLGLEVALWFELNPRKIGQRIHGSLVYGYEHLNGWLEAPKRPHILVCVGVKGARAEIRECFQAHKLEEPRDFTCLA